MGSPNPIREYLGDDMRELINTDMGRAEVIAALAVVPVPEEIAPGATWKVHLEVLQALYPGEFVDWSPRLSRRVYWNGMRYVATGTGSSVRGAVQSLVWAAQHGTLVEPVKPGHLTWARLAQEQACCLPARARGLSVALGHPLGLNEQVPLHAWFALLSTSQQDIVWLADQGLLGPLLGARDHLQIDTDESFDEAVQEEADSETNGANPDSPEFEAAADYEYNRVARRILLDLRLAAPTHW